MRLIHFDMETQDPDDVMTLALLASHPRAELFSVTLMPGTQDQVGLVTHVLEQLNVRVGPNSGRRVLAIGGRHPVQENEKPSVSAFHRKWLGNWSPRPPTHKVDDVLEIASRAGCTLLTGAPLKNFSSRTHVRFPRWVAQGGFAGDSVVPPEHRLPKFAGKETCATFNFGGSPATAEFMLSNHHIGEKLLVSKNVCHGVSWDADFHERVRALRRRTAGLDLAFRGMELYLEAHPDGKKLHDPLAMVVAIEPGVCEFRRVEMYRDKGEWGARLRPDSDVQISVSVDRSRFFDVLTEA